MGLLFFLFILIVCFTSNSVYSIAVLPHSPGVLYCHLLLRRETRIPGVALFSFRIGFWDLFVHMGQKSYTPTAFGKLLTTPGVRSSIFFIDCQGRPPLSFLVLYLQFEPFPPKEIQDQPMPFIKLRQNIVLIENRHSCNTQCFSFLATSRLEGHILHV